jgi:hypothetical protein
MENANLQKADPKLLADQLGHTFDVPLNVYDESPVAGRPGIVNELELLVQWCSRSAEAERL